MRIEITKVNGTHVFDLFPTNTPANLDGLDLMTARSRDHEFFAVYAQGETEIAGWIEAKGGKGAGNGPRLFRAIPNLPAPFNRPDLWTKTRKAAVSDLEADIRIHGENKDRAADAAAMAAEAQPTRNETRAANLAAITEEFRTVEVMTDAGTVYATAGFVRQDADGAVSQEIEITGGKVIGRIRRFGRQDFTAKDAAGNMVREGIMDQRGAIAAVVLADAENEAHAENAQRDADAAELAETRDAAHGLITATAKRAAARIRQDRAETAAERSASRAAMAATLAHQAAAEALDAGSEATRLALLVKPGADAAEVEDAAGAAIAAADAAARSAGQAKAAAELAAAYAAEALEIAQYAPEAPEDVQASTDTPEAPEAVSEAQGAAGGPVMVPVKPGPHGYRHLTPAEAIEAGQADRPRFLNRQRVNIVMLGGQPDEGRKPAEVTETAPLGAPTVKVRTLDGNALLVHWSTVEAL